MDTLFWVHAPWEALIPDHTDEDIFERYDFENQKFLGTFEWRLDVFVFVFFVLEFFFSGTFWSLEVNLLIFFWVVSWAIFVARNLLGVWTLILFILLGPFNFQ